MPKGNSVRLPASATEPQGEVLSAAADQTLSGGHMKAAGPMSSYSASSWAEATAAAAAMAPRMDRRRDMF